METNAVFIKCEQKIKPEIPECRQTDRQTGRHYSVLRIVGEGMDLSVLFCRQSEVYSVGNMKMNIGT
jgi:hypothetical protein